MEVSHSYFEEETKPRVKLQHKVYSVQTLDTVHLSATVVLLIT